jgi:rhodanese-related sulfurtransferase
MSVKKALYAHLARIGRALSSPQRLEILELLCQAERPVEELARETGLSIANASQHLRVLYEARLVEVRREGRHAYYRLADPSVCQVWQVLLRLGQLRLAEIDRLIRDYFASRDRLEPVEARTLWKRMREGRVVVLDVRPVEEYAAGHIPGARSVPISELRRRLSELPRDAEIVAYCRGPYCVLAAEALEVLRRRGVRARRLKGGFPEWWGAGLPVETGRGP